MKNRFEKPDPKPNLSDYQKELDSFSWEKVRMEMEGLPGNKGLNIAYEAVRKHALGPNKNITALKFLRKNDQVEDLSYSKLEELTNKFANVLSGLGLQKGERVFSLMGRIPELYVTALGTLKFTGVFCPLFSVFGPEPIFQRLSRGDVSILVTTMNLYNTRVKLIVEDLKSLKYILIADAEEHSSSNVLSLPLLLNEAYEHFEIPPTDPEDPALLHFTSGTTGMPKGALHVHKAVLVHYITGKYVLDFHPGDIFWCTADPGWVTGTSYGIISPLLNGVTSIVDEQEFDAMRWYQILQDNKVNIWYTAPTAIRRLMRMAIKPREVFNLEKLRVILSVGEPLSAEGVLWGKENLGIAILDNWWQTETGGIMIANYPGMTVKPGSMGRSLPGIEVGIGNLIEGQFQLEKKTEKEGHLVIKAGFPSMFRSYIHEVDRYIKCFHDGWYLSGDLAKMDKDGYFWFVGRADDIIKTSGHMVGPFEVESTLMRHPAVAEAAIIGKPEPSIGELVKAFIVLKPGFKPVTETKMDITGFARKELGPAVAPKEIEFIESIPKTKSGKILRRLLKARELGLPDGDLSTLEQN